VLRRVLDSPGPGSPRIPWPGLRGLRRGAIPRTSPPETSAPRRPSKRS